MPKETDVISMWLRIQDKELTQSIWNFIAVERNLEVEENESI